MVCQYGMSDRLGPRSFGDSSGHVFLGKEITRERNYSEETATLIDEEVKRLIDDSHEYAMGLLRDKKDVLDRVAEALVERETLDEQEFHALIEGRELPPMKKTPPPAPAPQEEEQPEKAPAKPKKAPPLAGPETQPST
jgi:cell division protease FtsH